jgi:hypothetical protein
MQLSKIQWWGSWCLGAIFLCLPACYNLLPLWHRQTPAYMEAGFDNELSASVVWTYGAFLRHVSLAESLWLVIFVQGLLMTGTIYYSFKYVFKTKSAWSYLFYVIVVSMTTAISFHSSYLMPDIFTPIMILSGGILLLVPTITTRDTIILSLLLLVATSMHPTHWSILTIIVLAVILGRFWKAAQPYYEAIGWTWKKACWVLGIAASSYLLVSTVHYSLGGDFRATRGDSFYLFARLWDYNLAQAPLQKYCSERSPAICTQLPTSIKGGEYLWGKRAEANLQNQGGWSEENRALFAQVNREVLSSSTGIKRYLIRTLEYTFAQLLYTQINPQRSGHEADLRASIQRFYPAYGVAASHSKQYLNSYQQETIAAKSQLQYLVLLLCSVIMFFIFFYKKMPPIQTFFTILIVLSLFVNALVVVSGWGYEDHLQSRVAWLLTLPVFWWLLTMLEQQNTRWLSKERYN